MIDERDIQNFRAAVWDYYRAHGRHDLPWRAADFDPYKIMVSELMLQQTQVARVIPKYQAFLELFPDVRSLAAAELGDVLRAWTGLGYNRRARFLWQAAQMIIDEYDGEFPATQTTLIKLPGVGVNTAGAILAYAFDQPVVFLETNIRTVYIHHFFNDEMGIADTAILELVQQTIDHEHPREWYWALMDYGSHLKQQVGNLNRQSKTYARQSTFQGSRRQIRGQIIRLLGVKPQTAHELRRSIVDIRLTEVLVELHKEGLIKKENSHFKL